MSGASSQFLQGYGPGYNVSWYRDLQHKRKEWLVGGNHSTTTVPEDAVTSFQYIRCCSVQEMQQKKQRQPAANQSQVRNGFPYDPLKQLNRCEGAMKERPVWDLWSTTAGSELWTWGREDCWENYSVLQRGVFGENVVMYAFLLRQFGRAMGLLDWMKENRSTLVGKPYPQIILLPYQLRNSAATKEQSLRGIPSKWNFSFYEGETLLHIAVVNSAYDHVKKLLEDHLDKAIEEKLLTKQDKYDFIHRRAIGSFFDKIENPVCYYGEYALSFAVSQTIMPWGETQEKLIDLLIKHGADINARDSHGNTALHMAVYHNKPQVFRYLCSEYKGTINQSIHNREGYTPLLMAVRLGNEEMFYVALREQSELSWEFDHIASYQMPMRELDTLEAGLAHEEYLKRLSAEGGGPQQDDAAASLFGRANGLGQANDAQRERDALKQEWLSTMENTIPEIAPPGLSALGIIVNHRYGHFLQNGILNEILNFKWKRYAFWDFAATCVCYMVLIILATVLAATKGTSKSVAWLEYTCFALVLFFWMLKAWDFYASLYGMQIKQEMPQLYPPPVKFPDGFELADGNASGRNFDLYEKAFKSTMPPSPALRRLSVWWQLVVKPHLELVSQRFTLTVVYEIALMLFLGCTTIHWITWIVNPDSFANRTMSDGFLASGLVFGWFYTWFFARSSQQLGPFVVMLVNMLLGDIVKRFALIYGTIILSYAAALSLLYRSSSTVEDGESCPFCTFSSSILTLFRTMVGDVAYEEYCPPEQESCVLVTFLFVGFTLMSNLVLLNLLIALMNTTYTTTMSDAEDQAMLQKAEIILATEARWKPVWRFFSKLSRNRRNNKVNPDNKQNTNDSCERLRLFRFGDPSSDPTNTTFYAHVNMYSDKYLQPKADTAAVHEAEGQPNSIQLQVPSMPGNQHRDSSTLGMIAALLNSRIRAQR